MIIWQRKTLIHQENYYLKWFYWKRNQKQIENTSNNSNKDNTEGMAKSFLPWEKIKRIAKKNGIVVFFTKVTNFETEVKEIRKKGVVCSIICRRKRCKIEYIGQRGRQLKSRIKEQADSKLDFWKKLGRKRKNKSSDLIIQVLLSI